MKRIFVCENPYVLYKVLVKNITNKEDENDILISDNFPDLMRIHQALKETKIFKEVMSFHYEPNTKYNSMVVKRSDNAFVQLWLFLQRYWGNTFHQKKLKAVKELQRIDFSQYDQIFVSDFDVSIVNGYLAENKFEYTLMEHAKYVFRRDNVGLVYNTVTYMAHMLEKVGLITGIRIATKYCRCVEVSKNKDLGRCLGLKEIVEWDVDEQIKKISAQEKNQIFMIYANAYDIYIEKERQANLLLTNPLFLDGLVNSWEEQRKVYQWIIENNFEKESVIYIKPHPRDMMDYAHEFKNVEVIDKGVSAEVLQLSSELRFRKVLTFYSTSVNSFKGVAEEVVSLERTEEDARKSKILQAKY